MRKDKTRTFRKRERTCRGLAIFIPHRVFERQLAQRWVHSSIVDAITQNRASPDRNIAWFTYTVESNSRKMQESLFAVRCSSGVAQCGSLAFAVAVAAGKCTGTRFTAVGNVLVTRTRIRITNTTLRLSSQKYKRKYSDESLVCGANERRLRGHGVGVQCPSLFLFVFLSPFPFDGYHSLSLSF